MGGKVKLHLYYGIHTLNYREVYAGPKFIQVQLLKTEIFFVFNSTKGVHKGK